MKPLTVLLCFFCVFCDRIGESYGDDLAGFWQPNVVNKTGVQPHENSSKDIVFADHPKAVSLSPDQPPKQDPASSQQPAQSQTSPASPESLPVNATSRDDIYKKYGSPTADMPIKAIKDAPPPLQALFECVHIGDDQCAFEYAQQVARWDHRVQDTVSKVTEYRLIGQEAEGYRPSLDTDAAEDAVSPERLKVAKFLKEARARLASKKTDLGKVLGGETAVDEGTELSARGRMTDKPAGAVPVDPEGKVTVLVFFKETGDGTKELNESVKPLKKLIRPDGSVKILGLTSHSYSKTGLRRVSAETSFPFPLLSGEALSKELLITRYPTFFFVAPTSKATYRLEGERGAEEIEKVVRLMQGGK